MEDVLLAVGKVTKIEERMVKGGTPQLQTTLKVIQQEAEGTKNFDPNLKEFMIKGQLEFGKRYEVLIRLAPQLDLDLPTRMIREEDEPTPESSFRRPKKANEYRDYQFAPDPDPYDDEDIRI